MVVFHTTLFHDALSLITPTKNNAEEETLLPSITDPQKKKQ